MVEGVIRAGAGVVSDVLLKVLVGFLGAVGALLIFFGIFYLHELWVLLGAIIIILALVVYGIIYVLGLFSAVNEGMETVKDGVKTVRQVKDLVDEAAPGAIPLVQKGVQRGLDVVTGRRPLFQEDAQQPARPRPDHQHETVPPPPVPPGPVQPKTSEPPAYQVAAYQQPAYQQPADQQPAYHQPTPPATPPPPPPPPPPVPSSIEEGGPVYLPCPTCGAGNLPGVTYCHFCKHPFN